MRLRVSMLAAAPLVAGCITTHPDVDAEAVRIQGMVGFAELTPDLTLDPAVGIQPEPGDLSGPSIGGAVMKRLAGDGAEVGLEGGFTMTWDRNRTLLVAGDASSVANEDIFLADLFGGPYVDLRGDLLRAYAGAGPLLQYGEVRLKSTGGLDSLLLDEDGTFGWGTYARTGLELRIGPSMYLGVGVRWVHSRLDLSGGFHDLDLDGAQYFVTVTDVGWARPFY